MIKFEVLYRKHPLNSMASGQEYLDTSVPCSYNPSNYRINLRDNDMLEILNKTT